MPPRNRRLIDGPEQDLLDDVEMAQYLHIEPKTLRRLVDAGLFPEALHVTERGRLWPWTDAVHYLLGVNSRHRFRDKKGQVATLEDKCETR